MYCVPVPPLCGDVVLIVCEEPDVQLNVCVEEYEKPSTVKERPEGLVVTVTLIIDGVIVNDHVEDQSLHNPFIP